MTHIERTIQVDAPPEAVFEVLTDLDGLPDWSTITVETHDTPSEPLSPGHTFTQTLRVLGRNLDAHWEVKEVDPPHRAAYEASAPGNGWLRMTQQVQPVEGGSRVEFDIDYELPGGFLGDWLDQGYVQRRNEREAEHCLQNLKDVVEASARRR